VLSALHQLWILREQRDEYIGTLVNAYLAAGGEAVGVRAGTDYVDVGTLHGYREAIQLLSATPAERPDPVLVPHIALARTGISAVGAPSSAASVPTIGGTP
jgi:hypothetical protein